MTSHAFLLAGLLAGISIAVPVGPMGLLCIQRTLASGMRIGVSTGLGAVTVNLLHGAAILLGANTLAPLLSGGGRVLGVFGGLFLLWSAARTWRPGRPAQGPAAMPALSPPAAYGSAVLFNATNPMALLLIVALLSPLIGAAQPSLVQAALFLGGMFTAAMAWWVCLSGGVALLRARLSPAVLLRLNQAAAMLLTLYGAAVLARTAGL